LYLHSRLKNSTSQLAAYIWKKPRAVGAVPPLRSLDFLPELFFATVGQSKNAPTIDATAAPRNSISVGEQAIQDHSIIIMGFVHAEPRQ
jgi:hypothetical protein